MRQQNRRLARQIRLYGRLSGPGLAVAVDAHNGAFGAGGLDDEALRLGASPRAHRRAAPAVGDVSERVDPAVETTRFAAEDVWIAERVGEQRASFICCAEAIGESGRFTFHAGGDLRLYPTASAERGTAWLKLTARGRGGHGSKPNPDNAQLRVHPGTGERVPLDALRFAVRVMGQLLTGP